MAAAPAYVSDDLATAREHVRWFPALVSNHVMDLIARYDPTELPPELTRLRIAAQKYAVFAHRDHISTIRNTVMTIWNRWLPESGHEVADAPDFERYTDSFDPRTGKGGLEIWIPLKG